MYKNYFAYAYAKNVHSQNGEDGIVAELLNRLKIKSGWVCEFGAWDGIHLSNTFNLVKNGDFRAVFIEGDDEKYNDLLTTVKQYPNIHPVKALVDFEGPNTLDQILAETEIPKDFDILSIDIDSYDYQVWKSLVNYQPKLVIVEINSSVNPNDPKHIHEPNKYQGTGFKPMFDLGLEKGYKFLLHTGNMFFVRNDLFDQLNISYEDPLENFKRSWLS